MKKAPASYTLEKFASGMHYVMLDEAMAGKFIKAGHKRLVCSAGDIEFHCAIMPKKVGGYFINMGARICKQLGVKAGSVVKLSFRADQSEYQFEMPEEFREVLDTDPKASKIFHGLTEGNQRGLIYLVTQVKSAEKRIERALRIADKIKSGVTSPRLILK